MKAYLKFDLPEDQDDFTLATKGVKYRLCLYDLNEWLQSELKYRGELWPEKSGYITLEKVRDRLFEILDDRNCRLDDVS